MDTNSNQGQLPINRGETRIQRVTSIYRDLFKNKYGIYPKLRMAVVGACIDNLAKDYTELQISALLIVFFDWKGMAGDSNFDYQRLLDNTHPFGWFYAGVNKYEVYLRNVFGLNFDDEESVREFVGNNMLAINNN